MVLYLPTTDYRPHFDPRASSSDSFPNERKLLKNLKPCGLGFGILGSGFRVLFWQPSKPSFKSFQAEGDNKGLGQGWFCSEGTLGQQLT